MARNEKRRQASLQRHASKRKNLSKLQSAGPTAPSSARGIIRMAAHWPVHECLISRNWPQEGELVQMLVARRSTGGQIAAATFLVDLGCLGVKNAFAALFDSHGDYEQRLRASVRARLPMERASLDLVARVVRDAITYARSLGFPPHPDYFDASVLLEGANPDAVSASVPLGKEGKPFFVAGPYDDARGIIRKLEKAVGPGNFYAVGPAEMLGALAPEIEVEEEGEEEENP